MNTSPNSARPRPARGSRWEADPAARAAARQVSAPGAAISPSGPVYRISDVELASRLSFFLWSSIPDNELLSIAESRRLSEPSVLRQQVQRMLADPRSQALVKNFSGQWLFLRNLAKVHPDQHDVDDIPRYPRARQAAGIADRKTGARNR